MNYESVINQRGLQPIYRENNATVQCAGMLSNLNH